MHCPSPHYEDRYSATTALDDWAGLIPDYPAHRLALAFFSTALPAWMRRLLYKQYLQGPARSGHPRWDPAALAQTPVPLCEGDRVGPWKVLRCTPESVVLSDRAFHLSFELELHAEIKANQIVYTAITRVFCDDGFGKLYFALVKPWHTRLVPRYLRRVARAVVVSELALVRAVLQQIGRGQAKLSYRTRGANNRLFRAESAGEVFLVKEGLNPDFRMLHREFQFLRRTDGIGPRVYAFSARPPQGMQCLVMECIEGDHPETGTSGFPHRLGAAMATWHRIPAFVDWLPRENWQTFLSERVLRPLAGDPDGVAFDLVCQTAFRTGEALYAHSTEKAVANGDLPVIVHGDLIPLNMLVRPDGSLCVLDWEGARLDEPEADLATAIVGCALSTEQVSELIQGYALPVDGAKLEFRLALHLLQIAGWRLACQVPQSKLASDAELWRKRACAEISAAAERLQSIGL